MASSSLSALFLRSSWCFIIECQCAAIMLCNTRVIVFDLAGIDHTQFADHSKANNTIGNLTWRPCLIYGIIFFLTRVHFCRFRIFLICLVLLISKQRLKDFWSRLELKIGVFDFWVDSVIFEGMKCAFFFYSGSVVYEMLIQFCWTRFLAITIYLIDNLVLTV